MQACILLFGKPWSLAEESWPPSMGRQWFWKCKWVARGSGYLYTKNHVSGCFICVTPAHSSGERSTEAETASQEKHQVVSSSFYLFIFKERGRKGERDRENHQCVLASLVPPTRDLACNPSMCPRLGVKLVTLWFTGWRSIHWVTPARAQGKKI